MEAIERLILRPLKLVLRYWQVLVIVYAASLLSGTALALLPALSLLPLSRLTALSEAARGITTSMLLDLLSFSLGRGGAGPDTTLPGWESFSLAMVVIGLVLPVAALLLSALLTGGIYRTYASAPEHFTLREFLRACIRWFPAVLALDLLTTAALLLLIAGGALLIPIAAIITGAAGWSAFAVTLVVGGVVWLISELAAAVMADRDSRNLWQGVGGAARVMVRKPGWFAALLVLSLALLGGVHALFRLGLMPQMPLEQGALVFLVTQAFVASRLAVRLVRAGGEVVIVRIGELAPNQESRKTGMEASV
jgi:hypothetical protein